MGRIGRALAAWAFLASGVAIAEQKPAKVAITPASTDGAIIFRSPRLPVPPTVKSAYRLQIMPYDDGRGKMGGLLGGGTSVAAKPGNLAAGEYFVATLKPGTYVIESLSRQDYFAVCFNGDSRQFTMKPGELLYLGDFDAASHVAELQRLVLASGRGTSRNSEPIHFFDTVAPPAFAPVAPEDLARVAQAVKAAMPKTSVAPVAVRFSPAKFGTGSDLFGMQRVCGGYHRKGAK